MLPPLARDRRITIVDYNAQLFIAELSRNLAIRGHDITYLCGASRVTLPSAVTQRLRDAGVQVEELSVSSNRQSPATRRSQLKLGLALARKVNTGTVVGHQLPLITNRMLLTATRFRSNRYVSWIQNFQTKRSFFTRQGTGNTPSRFERYQLGSAHQVICSSDEIALRVLASGREGLTSSLPNWAPLELIGTCRRNNHWAHRVGLDPNRFWVAYSGPLESKHRVGDISRMVKRLLDYDQFEFIFTGQGSGYEELEYDTTFSRSAHVHFVGPQQTEVLPQILGAANVLIATLDPESNEGAAADNVMAYLCAGRPVIGLMDDCCPSAEMILDAEAGRIASNAEALADDIIDMARDSEASLLAGKRAREYAERFFDPDHTTSRFVETAELL